MRTIFYYFLVPKGIQNLRNMRKNLVEDVNLFFDECIKNTPYENQGIIYNYKNSKRLLTNNIKRF